MRCHYRETKYLCGDYMEVLIYPVYISSTAKLRGRRAKPTSEARQKINDKKSENKMIRLANRNFTNHDLKIELTYSPQHNPETDEEAARQLTCYLRRVKRFRKRNNLPELKYIATTERGALKGRYHHHLIMNGGIELFDLVKLWGLGIVGTDLLMFDENGIASLAKYMMKQARELPGKKKYTRSKNLIDPEIRQSDHRFSQRQVKELAKDPEDHAPYEKLYEGYYVSGNAETFYNDETGGVYLHIRLYSKEAEWCRQGTRGMNRARSSNGRRSQKGSIPNSA